MASGTSSVPSGPPSVEASQRLFEEACRYIPGGTSRIHYFYEPSPIYARSGAGCRLTDVDGVTRLDLVNNMTSLIHGHAHPGILAAIAEQMTRGTAWSEPGEEEVRLARHLVERVPSIERIRFGNSGTEGVMMAVKLAREFTGRHKIAKFEGFYHGYYDYIQVSVKSGPANWGPESEPSSVPNSGGLSPGVLGEVVTVPFNNPDALAALLATHGPSLAAFLVDPLASQAGSPIPAPGFLDLLTELTRQHGIVLIYDEVVSFRLGYGGAQERYGGTPDLTALGKIIGGGLPIGAVGGRADIMSLVDPTKGPPRVLSGGTFSANPLTMVAGLAAMEAYTRAEVDRVNALGARMRERMNALFLGRHEPMFAAGDGSMSRILLMQEPVRNYRHFVQASGPAKRLAALHAQLLDEGVIITRMGTQCISTPMREADVDEFIEALDRALDRLG